MSFLDRLFRRGGRAAAPPAERGEVGGAGDAPRAARSDEYRAADPREVVEEEGTVTGAPGGSPQDTASADERRRADLADD